MAVVPDTHDFGSGVVTTSEDNTYIRDPIRFLLNKPAAQLRQSATQTLTNDIWTSITLTIEDLDNDPGGTGAHSTSSNTSRFTAVYAGWHSTGGVICFAPNGTGSRSARWAVNGAAVNGSISTVPSVIGGVFYTQVSAVATLVFLNVGDYLELQGRQESGANLDTVVNGAESCSMTVIWQRN